MKRREFVQTCVAGAATGGFLLDDVTIGQEAGQSQPAPISPDDLAQAAKRYFLDRRRSCVESILLAGCEALKIKSDVVPEIAMGLAGGIGMQGETCGVLTGSALVLSLAVARKEKETEYPKELMRTVEAVGRLLQAFKKECGHTDCRSLTGVDLTTAEGRERHKTSIRAQKCAGYVTTAARLLAHELNKPAGG